MQPPPTPNDEESRLAELHGLELLDSPAEERFDRFTRLARRLFGVPIALVSLVDSDRQWFKSRQGLDAEETPREVSFCGHAVLEDALFVVEDTRDDARFADNPLVTGAPHIRFYAGFPLTGPGGYRVGTLCIIDTEPRSFGCEDREMLRDLGSMVRTELAAVEIATLDDLTRISSRRGFLALSERALSQCVRADQTAAVLMIDMDGFKQINDQHGHPVGDAALVEFAALLVETFRTSDVVGRLGGDEFAVLLVGATEETAALSLRRLEAAVRRRNETTPHPYALAYSAGLAQCIDGTDALQAALERADQRMYDRKRDHKRRAA